MQIVITNDDGWGSQGIMLLTQLMLTLGDVVVVAPDGPRSGMSAAISVQKNITLRRLTAADAQSEREKQLIDKAQVYVTNGNPADCVKLAINALFCGDDKRINLLVSGINHGHNASVNIHYSGTMGACFVAAEHIIPTIGFSINNHLEDADMHWFEAYIIDIVHHYLQKKSALCWNVNAPEGAIRGVRFTRQAKGHWDKELQQHTDDNGIPYYTLTGEFVNHEPDAQDTDIWCIEHGYISIQPIHLDMTDYSQL